MGIRDQGTCRSAYAETVATVLEYKSNQQISLSSDSLVDTCMPTVQSVSLAASLIEAQVKGLEPVPLLVRSARQSTAPVKGNPCHKQLNGDETALRNHLKEYGPGIVMIGE